MSEDPNRTEERKAGIEERNKQRKVRSLSDWKKLLDTAEGRRQVRQIMEITGWLNGPYFLFDPNNSVMCRRLGRWEVGHAMFKILWENFPNELLLMEREAKSDKLVSEQEIKNEGEKYAD